MMEVTNCNLCHSSEFRCLFKISDAKTNEEFSILRCRNCGLVCLNPKLNQQQLEAYYPPQYYLRGSPPKSEKQLRQYQEDKIKKLEKFKKPGRVLDIGCGIGRFLAIARERGYECYGVESSKLASDYAATHLRLNVINGDLLDAGYPRGYFDVITLYHVLEHLSYPKETLMKVREILKEDGILIITAPNFASPEAKIFKDRWFHLDVPRHLYHFTPTSLHRLLNEAGFKVVKTSYFSREHNYPGLKYSFYNFLFLHKPRIAFTKPLSNAKGAKGEQGTRFFKEGAEGIINFGLKGLNVLLSLTRLSGTFEVYCQKAMSHIPLNMAQDTSGRNN